MHRMAPPPSPPSKKTPLEVTATDVTAAFILICRQRCTYTMSATPPPPCRCSLLSLSLARSLALTLTALRIDLAVPRRKRPGQQREKKSMAAVFSPPMAVQLSAMNTKRVLSRWRRSLMCLVFMTAPPHTPALTEEPLAGNSGQITNKTQSWQPRLQVSFQESE